MRRITGTDAFNMMEAYNAVYETQEITEEQVQEDFENWVNSLVEEGYDLSEFTWEDMYEEYITEIGVNFGGQAAELRAMQAASRQRQGLSQSFDMFDLIKGYLIDEGYAETEEAALQIMANMSEEWKQSIMEGPGGMMMSAASQGKGQVTVKKPAPQSAGGLTPMQRLQRKPDITIK